MLMLWCCFWLTSLFLERYRSTSSVSTGPKVPVENQLKVLHHLFDLARDPRLQTSENVQSERNALLQLCDMPKAWAVSFLGRLTLQLTMA